MFLGKSKINSFEKGISKEWIISDGKGTFAINTIIEVPTKKFHALFLKGTEPLLIKFEEKVKVGKKECFISTNRYAGVVYPDGYRYIIGVEFTPYPIYTYSINEALLRKRMLFLGEKLLINYQVLSCIEPVIFEISPLLPKTSEEFPLQHNIEFGTIVDVGKDKLMIRTSSGEYRSRFRIYENVEYLESGTKKAFWSPGYFSFSLVENESVTLEISTQANLTSIDFDKIWGFKERLHKGIMANMPDEENAVLSILVKVGDALLLDRGNLKGIVSGYPSFREKGRETFISLPGLLLSTGKINEAKLCFLRWMDYFTDEGLPYEIEEEKPIYKGYESTLWFAYALTKFLAYTNDVEFIKGILPKLENFIRFLLDSKKIDSDGLILEEDPSNNWMGLKLNDELIVERCGKLIELNALWYNMLSFVSKALDTLNVRHQYGELLNKIKENFISTFWSEEGYFKDTDNKKELRPNQVLAMSLPFTPVPKDIGRLALNNIWRHLYTTYGLRTLAPLEKKYKGREEGDEVQKLKARFRGMAWPWLLGQFFSALRRYFPEKSNLLKLMWMPFVAHIEEGCIGGIAEVFDGSMPYDPHGDILYAPSQGEIIRSFIEDVKGFRPVYESLWSNNLSK